MSALGPFTQTTFLGASVMQFNAKIGWDSSSSDFSVDLVEDKCNTPKLKYTDSFEAIEYSEPDSFRPPRLGRPGYFKFGAFEFSGLLESWEQSKSVDGGTVYAAQYVSPANILAGAQVVLSGADGHGFGIPNIFNVSNYCNPGGVPFGAIKGAIHAGGCPHYVNFSIVDPEVNDSDRVDGCTPIKDDEGNIIDYQDIQSVTVSAANVFHLRGRKYLLDCSEIPDTGLPFSGDSVDVLSVLVSAAKAAGGKIHLELISATISPQIAEDFGIEAFIKVRFTNTSETNPIARDVDAFADDDPETEADTRLSAGIIEDFAGTSSCTRGITSQTRGLERANTVSGAAIVGDFKQIIWSVTTINRDTEGEHEDPQGEEAVESAAGVDDAEQREANVNNAGRDQNANVEVDLQMGAGGNAGGGGAIGSGEGDATGQIMPYWGEDQLSGNVRIGSGSGDSHTVSIDISRQAFNAGPPTHNLTVGEMRAALDSFEAWVALFSTNPNTKGMYDTLTNHNGGPFDIGAGLAMLAGGDAEDLNPKAMWKLDKDKMKDEEEDFKKGGYDELRAFHAMVASIASKHYGKTWLIPLPMVSCCGSDSTIHNWEKSDGGWSEGCVLGVCGTPLEIFKTEDGRVGPFMHFQTNSAMDIEEVTCPYWQQGNNIYVRATFEKIIRPCGGAQAVLGIDGVPSKSHAHDGGFNLEIGHALWEMVFGNAKAAQHAERLEEAGNAATDGWPDGPDAGAPIDAGANPGGWNNARQQYMDQFYPDAQADLNDEEQKNLIELIKKHGADDFRGLGLCPKFQTPESAAVPLKSNSSSYGAWGAQTEDQVANGVEGQAAYERDSTLNPWNFGGSGGMTAAGSMLAASKISEQQVLEQGSVSAAGAPTVSSLGAAIQDAGPNLTGIDVSVGTGGITTSYTFRSHVTDFGDLVKARVDWMQKSAESQRKAQRAFNARLIAANDPGPKHSWMRAWLKAQWRRPGSSHEFMTASYNTKGAGGDDAAANAAAGLKETRVTFSSIPRSRPEQGMGDDAKWAKTAGGATDVLFRPYDTNYAGTTFTNFETPTGGSSLYCDGEGCQGLGGAGGFSNEAITVTELNPFKTTGGDQGTSAGHDMNYVHRNDEAPDSWRISDSEYGTTYRPIGIRGPMILVGWGYDQQGYPVPNKAGDGGRSLKFEDNWLGKPQNWKAGPVDLRWDNRRKVWGASNSNCYRLIKAILLEDLIPTVYGGDGCASGMIDEPVECGSGVILINDYLDQPVNSGSKLIAYFDPCTCEWTALQSQFRPMTIVTDICTSGNPNWTCGSCEGNTFQWETFTRNIYVQTAISPPTGTLMASGVMLSQVGGHLFSRVSQEC